MLNVFISHNYKDKPLARKISNEFTKYGIKPWIDESEIKLGESLIEKIRDGLDNMDYLVALISQNSVQSEWVKKELDIAMNSEIEGKRVITIPILAGKCDLPGFLKGKLYADMSTNRKYNENIHILLRRFNVSNITDDTNEFTEYKLTAVQVIEKIEKAENENELVEFLEGFGYTERSLFHRDTFIECLNKLFDDKSLSQDIIVSLISICRYCPDEYINKINLTKLLMRDDNEVLKATINVLAKTKSLKIQQKKILRILKNNLDDEVVNEILNYFIKVQLDIDIAQEVYEFCICKLKVKYSTNIINCLCRVSNFITEDNIYKIWSDYWKNSDSDRRLELVNSLCMYGFQSEGVYLNSPKLRNEIKQILMDSFGDSDVNNSNLMIALLTSAGNIVEDRNEIWSRMNQLDDYSILMTLEILRDEYNVDYLFNSEEDLYWLQKFVDSSNLKIKSTAVELIAEIYSKKAIDIIKESSEFIPQHYNANKVLFTLLKETNIVDYKELYNLVKRKVVDGYYSKIDNTILAISDYFIGESDTNVELIVESINFKIEDEKKNTRDDRVKMSVIVEKLIELKDCFDKKQNKKIQDFIDSYKKVYGISGEV
ncbi:MAG: toll/interleukin-1 receptor domain-containing protein [Clostridium beijerinckii]|nr:toll/interleukin-1 receptor domain-containing protein [Clostridium beijerinckii]